MLNQAVSALGNIVGRVLEALLHSWVIESLVNNGISLIDPIMDAWRTIACTLGLATMTGDPFFPNSPIRA